MRKRASLWLIGGLLLAGLGLLTPDVLAAGRDRAAVGTWDAKGVTTVTVNNGTKVVNERHDRQFTDRFTLLTNGSCKTTQYQTGRWSTSKGVLTITIDSREVARVAQILLAQTEMGTYVRVKSAGPFTFKASYTSRKLTRGSISGLVTLVDKKNSRNITTFTYTGTFSGSKPFYLPKPGAVAPGLRQPPPAPEDDFIVGPLLQSLRGESAPRGK